MGGGLFQPAHLLVILVIVLVVFGPAKLPELGSALGDGIRELKRALNDSQEDTSRATATPAAPPAVTADASVTACKHCATPAAAAAHFCTYCGQALG